MTTGPNSSGEGRITSAQFKAAKPATSRIARTSTSVRVRMGTPSRTVADILCSGASATVSGCRVCLTERVANSPAGLWLPSSNTMQKILRQIAAELRVQEGQVRAAVELLDGGATVPFIARYRKEATGGLDDIHLRELEAAPGLPARAGGAARGRPASSIDEQGKLTPELRAADRGRADQAGAGRPVPAVQAQAPHQGPDRPRSRPASRWPTCCGPTHARSRRRGRRLREGREGRGRRGLHHRAGRARRRARHPVRALGRRRCAGAVAARVAVDRGPAEVEAGRRQGRERSRRRQVPRLLRLRRADRPGAFAPGAGRVPRPRAGHPGSQAGAAGRARAGPALHRRRPHRPAPGLEPPASARPTTCCASAWPGPGASSCRCPPSATCSPACAKTPRRSPSRCSPRTCATCCWPRRPARAW